MEKTNSGELGRLTDEIRKSGAVIGISFPKMYFVIYDSETKNPLSTRNQIPIFTTKEKADDFLEGLPAEVKSQCKIDEIDTRRCSESGMTGLVDYVHGEVGDFEVVNF